MGILIFFFLMVIGVVAWYLVKKHTVENGSISVNENEIIKKFNKTVRRLTSRNIEDVKSDLFKILDKYKFVKCEQFIENRSQIQSARKQIEEQIRQTERARSDVSFQIRKLKSDSNVDEVLGAQLVYQYETMGDMVTKLTVAKDNLLTKECEFDRELDMFNSKFALKKAEVSMMVANAISMKNISSIDIRLEDLVAEFQQKANEQENADYVRGKIYGTPSPTSTTTEFNVEEYKTKFNNF